MKKIYLLLTAIFFALSYFSEGQSIMTNGDMEQWDNSTTPTGWVLAQNISQESTIVHGGSFSAAHTSAGAQKLKQVVTDIVPGQDYTISFWYYDNTDAAKIKLASAWLNSSGQTVPGNENELSPSSFNPDDDQWHQYSAVVTAPADAAKLKYFVKVLDQGSNTGGTVYYDDFYFGSVVVTPEPGNYPENFEATAQVLTMKLDWEAPTTGQLPDGYLVLGAKEGSSAPVPVDGTPVEDDFDWSDGLVAKNLPSNVNTFDFTELEGATSYTFTIYPYTNAGNYIDYKTDGNAPSSTGVTADAQMISFEGFESGTSGLWMTYNVTGDEEWIFPEFKERHTAKILGADGGVNYENEDWLISPALNLPTGNFDYYFSFVNSKNLDGDPLKLYISTDYDGSSDPNGFTWTDLTDLAVWSPGNYEWSFTEDLNLNDYVGGDFYLAFEYTSTASAAALYKLDNLQVYSKLKTGVGENALNTISVYPNPASGYFMISGDQNGEVSVFDLFGKEVLKTIIETGTNKINVSSLNSGIYFVNTILDNGSKLSTKIIIK